MGTQPRTVLEPYLRSFLSIVSSLSDEVSRQDATQFAAQVQMVERSSDELVSKIRGASLSLAPDDAAKEVFERYADETALKTEKLKAALLVRTFPSSLLLLSSFFLLYFSSCCTESCPFLLL